MSNPEKEGFLPIQAEALREGMYIWLDCPWYKHPFARNQFKLNSEKDIAQIRQLGLTNIYFDPRRSTRQATLEEEAALCEPGRRPEPDSAQPDLSGVKLPDAASQESIGADLDGSDTQEILKAANRAYGEVVHQTKEVLCLVKAGRKEGLEAAQTLVGDLVHQMVDEDMSVGLASLVNFKKLDRLQVLDTLNACILSVLVGRELELNREALRLLGLGALLHDIGQERLPTPVLYKIGPLTKAERSLFQLHPRFGKEMALQIPGFPQQSLEIIYQHHEHLDGSGFPEGLRGSRISFLAQIVRVVDVYGYLISPRDSEKRMTPAEALADLYVNRKRQFAKEIVTALVRVLSVYPPGTFVELSDGSIGVVISINLQDRMRPWVALLESGKGLDRPEVRNLLADQSLSIVRNVLLSEFPHDVIERVDLAQLLGYLLIQPAMSKTAGQNDRKAAAPTMVR
jgi:HD-GYP domain-containing protein (c-di-GMP phosphodiesterase class II)